MRLVSLALFLGAALFAQSPPAAPEEPSKPAAEPATQPEARKLTPEERARNTEMLKEALEKIKVNLVADPGAMLSPGKTCSIPLKNVMPQDAPPVDKAMILPAPSKPGRFAIRQITPPAPPCDDVKR